MARYELSDEQWDAIAPLLPIPKTGRPRRDDRTTLNGVFWKCLVPECHGRSPVALTTDELWDRFYTAAPAPRKPSADPSSAAKRP